MNIVKSFTEALFKDSTVDDLDEILLPLQNMQEDEEKVLFAKIFTIIFALGELLESKIVKNVVSVLCNYAYYDKAIEFARLSPEPLRRDLYKKIVEKAIRDDVHEPLEEVLKIVQGYISAQPLGKQYLNACVAAEYYSLALQAAESVGFIFPDEQLEDMIKGSIKYGCVSEACYIASLKPRLLTSAEIEDALAYNVKNAAFPPQARLALRLLKRNPNPQEQAFFSQYEK